VVAAARDDVACGVAQIGITESIDGRPQMDRREFLEASGVLAGSAVLRSLPTAQPAAPMMGIQIGAVSFVDEGTDRVLDALAEMASINTLFVATFTYGRGIAGRQLPNQPLPDHGKQ